MVPPIVLLGDQLPVPGQEGLRRDDGGDFTQQATPQRFGLGRQAPTLIVVQTETFVAELLSQHWVLFTVDWPGNARWGLVEGKLKLIPPSYAGAAPVLMRLMTLRMVVVSSSKPPWVVLAVEGPGATKAWTFGK